MKKLIALFVLIQCLNQMVLAGTNTVTTDLFQITNATDNAEGKINGDTIVTYPLPFINLSDVPASYTGSGRYRVIVKSTEDGLEFDSLGIGYTNCIGNINGGLYIALADGIITNIQYIPVLFSGPGSSGMVTSASTDTNNYLRGDGSWASPTSGQTFYATNFLYQTVGAPETNSWFTPFNPAGVMMSVGGRTNLVTWTSRAPMPVGQAFVHASNEVRFALFDAQAGGNLASNTTIRLHFTIWE